MPGGGGETTSTVTQTNLPAYAEPYYTGAMERAQAESQRPYQPYTGQRIASQSGDTLSGMQAVRNYAGSGYGAMNGATSLAGQVGQKALNAGNFQSTNFNYDKAGFGGMVNRVGFGQDGVDKIGVEKFGEAQRAEYTSPYMQAVVDKAKKDAALNHYQEQTYRDSGAASAGAFGGSRHAVQNQMATNSMMDRLTDIDVGGAQAAFENAQGQFERDRSAKFGADSANQQAGMQMGMANQGTGLQMVLANQQADLEAKRMSEQSRQAKAQFGLDGLRIANDSAMGMGKLAMDKDTMAQNRFKALMAAGQTQEDYDQRGLDQGYMDFTNQRDYNRQNIAYLMSIMQGVPMSANSDVSTTTPTNDLAGIMGLLMGGSAMSKLGQQ